MTEPLDELTSRLEAAAQRLRAGDLDAGAGDERGV